MNLSVKDVINDIVDTSFTIAFTEYFILESAILCASKAAYLALMVTKNTMNIGERYDKKVDLSNIVIGKREYKNLNSIKKFSPEAFFYWHKVIELLG